MFHGFFLKRAGACLCVVSMALWGCVDGAVPPSPDAQQTNGGHPLPGIHGEGGSSADSEVSSQSSSPGPATALNDGTMGGAAAVSGVENDRSPGPYEICSDGDECVSGYCIPGPDGQRVCSELCASDDDCPQEWECLAVANTRPDTVLICVARRQSQCLPCNTDGDCGTGIDRCIDVGRSKRCARSCETEECPDGNTCTPITMSDEVVPLCLPDEGTCEPCMDQDGDGYGNMGDCLGLDCDDTNVHSYEGAPELCDGLDNDCDTVPDEDVPVDEVLYFDDVDNCGQCGQRCTNEHGETECIAGICMPTCAGLFGDCNGDPIDGCETPLDTASHCGQCGQVCVLPNATASCATGDCTLISCDQGFGDCDLELSEATGCEVDLNTDIANCGRCGERCVNPNGAAACQEGACAITCSAGFDDCDRDVVTGCEQSLSDLRHCGRCGEACNLANAISMCQDQTCVRDACEAGWCDPNDDDASGCFERLDSCEIVLEEGQMVERCADPLCGQSAIELESIRGDKGSDRRVESHYGEKAFRIRVREDEGNAFSCKALRIQATLEPPPGAEYLLEAWCDNGCEGAGRQSNLGAGRPTDVVLKWEEGCNFLGIPTGGDDSRTINIRVRYVNANTCAPWRLELRGNNGGDGFSCN